MKYAKPSKARGAIVQKGGGIIEDGLTPLASLVPIPMIMPNHVVPSESTIRRHAPWILVLLAFLLLIVIGVLMVFLRRRVSRAELDSMDAAQYKDDEELDDTETKRGGGGSTQQGRGKAVRGYAITIDKLRGQKLNAAVAEPTFEEELTVSCASSGSSVSAVRCVYDRAWWVVFRQDGGVSDAFASDVASGRIRYAVFSGVVMRVRSGEAALRSLSTDQLKQAYRALAPSGNNEQNDKNTTNVLDVNMDPGNVLRTANFNIVVVAPAYDARVTNPTRALKDCAPIISLPWPRTMS